MRAVVDYDAGGRRRPGGPRQLRKHLDVSRLGGRPPGTLVILDEDVDRTPKNHGMRANLVGRQRHDPHVRTAPGALEVRATQTGRFLLSGEGRILHDPDNQAVEGG
jgi:hypothetical protein